MTTSRGSVDRARALDPRWWDAFAEYCRSRGAMRVIDDAGHVPHIEQPEAVLRALSEFIPTPRRKAEAL